MSERAVSVRPSLMPLLDAVTIKTGKRGRPRKRPKVLATDKGYDAKELRHQLRKHGLLPGYAGASGRAARPQDGAAS